MKKRLLSAALAFAMVLTLLPLSAMPASATATPPVGDGKETVTYYDKNNATLGVDGAPGWFVQTKGNDDSDKNKTYYTKVTEGFVVSGKYWKDSLPTNATTGALTSTTFTVIGGSSVEIDAKDATSLNIDLYGGSITIKGSKLTSITVNNSKKDNDGDQRPSVTLDSSVSGANHALTLSLTNVQSTSTISLESASDATAAYAHSVTLNNAKVGAITLSDADGKAANQTVSLSNGSESGAITVTGHNSGSRIAIADSSTGSTPGAVSLTAPGGSVAVSGQSSVGKITVSSGSDEEKAVAVPSVNVTGGSVAGIERDTNDKSTTASSFTVGSAANISAAISTSNGSVTVNQGTTSDISVTTGTVTVNGPTAKVGDVTLGARGKGTATFKVTGTGNDVGTVTNDAGTLTVDIPNDPKNTFGELKDGAGSYTGHGVKGGTFTKAVPAGWLANSGATTLYYQLAAKSNGPITYYTAAQLGEALTAQDGGEITIVGQENPSQTISFMNGDQPWGTVKVLPNSTIILPTKVNGVTVSNWHDGTYTTAAGSEYPTPKAGTTATLNAQATTNEVTKLTSVSAGANADNIKATLNGNVITLSGAVTSAAGTISVNLVTDLLQDDGTYLEEEVIISYKTNPSSATFANPGSTGLTHGMTLQNNFTVLRLSNGTTYTVNGSGLKLAASEITVDGGINGKSGTAGKIVATVSIGGYTQAQKDALIALIEGASEPFAFGDSTAMLQAINAALATISDSQVNTWRQTAQRAAWQAKNTGTPTTALMAETGFDNVVLVPYLAVNVTAYNANGTMTATLTPSYRVVVKDPGNGDYTGVFTGKTTADADGNYIVKAGASLGTLSSEFGEVTVTFNNLFASKTIYAHQDSQYVYEYKNNAMTIKHPGTTGLGTLVFNTTAPLVTLTHAQGAVGSDGKTDGVTNSAAEVLYYDSLQAAVDDTLPQATDALMDKIEVASAYTGTGAVSVTGLSRKFQITTIGNTTISAAANASVVDVAANGHTYTIQLLKDNVTNANIIVASADNGTAGASVVNAKPGEQVTVTIQPKEGYQGTVTAKTNTGANVSVTNSGTNTFTFNVPDGATSVTVTPVFTLLSKLPFTDVATTDSYYNAVLWNYENNFIQGTTATTFRPSYALTRAQLVTILYRNAGSPTVSNTVSPYTDTNVASVDGEMLRAIIWATNNRIVEGYGNGQFGPNNTVRKQELAKILYQYNVYRRGSTSGTVNLSTYFTDASSISNWAVPYVQWAVANGVMGASTARQFQPQAQMTRAQTAVCVYNYGIRFVKS